MSVENNIFLSGTKIPSPSQWREAILMAGFKMDMDVNFDMKTFMGFLPCTYQGINAGFEYYIEELEKKIYLMLNYKKSRKEITSLPWSHMQIFVNT